MTLSIQLEVQGLTLPDVDRRRSRAQLRSLERRLKERPELTSVFVLRQHADQWRVEADRRVELGPLGPTPVSHPAAETADVAIRRAVEDIDREPRAARAARRPAFLPQFNAAERLPRATLPATRASNACPSKNESHTAQ
ncbi:MAG: hypothetical protein M3069_31430 [Chloroflexota bacterium]|nr:hypothetical protein [Chloroflexota bacterium]